MVGPWEGISEVDTGNKIWIWGPNTWSGLFDCSYDMMKKGRILCQKNVEVNATWPNGFKYSNKLGRQTPSMA